MSPQTRLTRQRVVILDELRKLTSHPTADELYTLVRERIPRISLGTVYRNLDFLAETGEILKLESAGSTRRFDGCVIPHQHVRCIMCGKVGDVQPMHEVPAVTEVAAHGFRVTGARVEFEGLCEACEACEISGGSGATRSTPFSPAQSGCIPPAI